MTFKTKELSHKTDKPPSVIPIITADRKVDVILYSRLSSLVLAVMRDMLKYVVRNRFLLKMLLHGLHWLFNIVCETYFNRRY